jgi:hypothetical protein
VTAVPLVLTRPTSKPKEGGGSGRAGGHRHKAPRRAELKEGEIRRGRHRRPTTGDLAALAAAAAAAAKWESKAAEEISAGSMDPADGKRGGGGDCSAPER